MSEASLKAGITTRFVISGEEWERIRAIAQDRGMKLGDMLGTILTDWLKKREAESE